MGSDTTPARIQEPQTTARAPPEVGFWVLLNQGHEADRVIARPGEFRGLQAPLKPMVKKKFSSPRYEKELKRKKSYERKVLKYLKEHGPQNYDHLVIELDRQNTGNIAIALQALLHGKHIKRNGDDVVITEAGLRLHEDDTYWI